MRPLMKWDIFLACAAGKHHLSGGVPCQDAGHYMARADGFIGAVCDGAGSAGEGRLGAELFARAVTERLDAALAAGRFAGNGGPGDRDNLLQVVEQARREIGAVASSRQLALPEFACTLVGCLALGGRGCFFHVGDGFGIFQGQAGESILSLPENGEYADETYFVTDESWQEHFRVTPIPDIRSGCLIGLLSDGAAPFAVNRSRSGFYPPFIDPVAAFLRGATRDNGSQALKNVLENEKTLEITPDDKALLLALAS